ncbi:hypothetical protein [Enterococcus gilvus]|uniref:hypothetical protein n=1 Tax=Enterococcus gilvus TaxID=160453 RepID=UPI0013B35C7B|nr:hypothetical protein [Enterococcus gilvus]
MIRAEWRSLLKNKFLLIVLGAIALIPALYNLIFWVRCGTPMVRWINCRWRS